MINAVIKYADNSVSIHSSQTKYVGTQFDSGFYEVFTNNQGELVISEEYLPESHNPYNTSQNVIVLETIDSFFQPGVKEKVAQLGFIHKLGILLHGRQGTGKTSLLNFVAKKLIEERGAIVFFCNSTATLNGGIRLAKMIREVQDNPIVFIADEFERYAQKAEAEMKIFLDGKDSVDNTLFLAATNYFSLIPKTLSERPSRFKVVLEISGIDDKDMIRGIIYDISNKIKPGLFTKSEIMRIVKNTKEATLDEIKHICLDKLTNSYLPDAVTKSKIGFSTAKKQLAATNDEDIEIEDSWSSFSYTSFPSKKSKEQDV